MLWRLAVRNVARNPRRTGLTLAAVVLGVCATVFVQGFINGFLSMITGVLIEGRLGAIQVHARGFLEAESDPLRFSMDGSPAFLARLTQVPGVTFVAPRISFEALVANGAQSSMAFVTAVDPVPERNVCPKRWLTVQGGDFIPRTPDDALMGAALMEGMGVKEGDTLTLTAAGPSGAQNALDVRLVHSLGTMDPLQSKRMLEITLPHAQELLSMPGRITQVVVGVEPDASLDAVALKLAAALGPEFSVLTWLQLTPELSDNLTTISTVMWFIIAFLQMLVLSGIANTMLMAVHERTREIGTMLAMGMRRSAITRLILAEATVLGTLGGALGGLLGYTLVAVAHRVGMALPIPGSDVPNFLRPATTWPFVLLVALLCAAGSGVASWFPARRASRLRPVEALRNE